MLLAAAATARRAHAEQAHAHVHAKMREYVHLHTRALGRPPLFARRVRAHTRVSHAAPD